MMTSLSVVYAASFTFGVGQQGDPDADEQYDGTLLASLIILPQWSAYFGNPTGNTMGLIAASFYFRTSQDHTELTMKPKSWLPLSHLIAVIALVVGHPYSLGRVLPSLGHWSHASPTHETCLSGAE
jgi:hypothetical protein